MCCISSTSVTCQFSQNLCHLLRNCDIWSNQNHMIWLCSWYCLWLPYHCSICATWKQSNVKEESNASMFVCVWNDLMWPITLIKLRYPQILKERRSHLIIVGARRVTWITSHTEDPYVGCHCKKVSYPDDLACRICTSTIKTANFKSNG